MPLQTGQLAPDFTATVAGGEKIQLSSLIKDGPVCVIFLRFMGCPLSRLRMAELEQELGAYSNKNLRLFVVLESRHDRVEHYLTKKNLHIEVLPDLERKLFDLYDVKPGGVEALLNPAVLTKGTKATLKGHMHGPFEGNELQLPAAFIIGQDGKLTYVNYGLHAADMAPTEQIVAHAQR